MREQSGRPETREWERREQVGRGGPGTREGDERRQGKCKKDGGIIIHSQYLTFLFYLYCVCLHW
jgi:hypothetical protein